MKVLHNRYIIDPLSASFNNF